MDNNQNEQKKSIFDMSDGKTFIGIGDRKANLKKSSKETLIHTLGGILAILLGMFVWMDLDHFFIGIIIIFVGAGVIYDAYDNKKMRCPQCGRNDGMKLVVSDDLAVDTDIARYNVYERGQVTGIYKHTHDKVDVRIETTHQDHEQCRFCGHCRSVIRTDRHSYKNNIYK